MPHSSASAPSSEATARQPRSLLAMIETEAAASVFFCPAKGSHAAAPLRLVVAGPELAAPPPRQRRACSLRSWRWSSTTPMPTASLSASTTAARAISLTPTLSTCNIPGTTGTAGPEPSSQVLRDAINRQLCARHPGRADGLDRALRGRMQFSITGPTRWASTPPSAASLRCRQAERRISTRLPRGRTRTWACGCRCCCRPARWRRRQGTDRPRRGSAASAFRPATAYYLHTSKPRNVRAPASSRAPPASSPQAVHPYPAVADAWKARRHHHLPDRHGESDKLGDARLPARRLADHLTSLWRRPAGTRR
jgi:hypothetical protein